MHVIWLCKALQSEYEEEDVCMQSMRRRMHACRV